MDIVINQPKLSGHSESEDGVLCTTSEIQQDLISKVDDSFAISECKAGTIADPTNLSTKREQINYNDNQEILLRCNKYKVGCSIEQSNRAIEEQTCNKKNQIDSLKTMEWKIDPISRLLVLSVKEEQTQSKLFGHPESKVETSCIIDRVLQDLITKVEILCIESDACSSTKLPDLIIKEGRSMQHDPSVQEEKILNESNEEDFPSSTEWEIDTNFFHHGLADKEKQKLAKISQHSTLVAQTLCKVNEVLHDLITKVEILCAENDNSISVEQPNLRKREGQTNYEDDAGSRIKLPDLIIEEGLSMQHDLCAKEEKIRNESNQEDFPSNIHSEINTNPLHHNLDDKAKQISTKISLHSTLDAHTLCKVNEILHDLIYKVEVLCAENENSINVEQPNLRKREEQINHENNRVNLIKSKEYMISCSSKQPNLFVIEEQFPNEKNQEDLVHYTEWIIDTISGQPDLGITEDKTNYEISRDNFLNSIEHKTGSSCQSDLPIEDEENENSQNLEPFYDDVEDSSDNDEDYIHVVEISSGPLEIEGISTESSPDEFLISSDPADDDVDGDDDERIIIQNDEEIGDQELEQPPQDMELERFMDFIRDTRLLMANIGAGDDDVFFDIVDDDDDDDEEDDEFEEM